MGCLALIDGLVVYVKAKLLELRGWRGCTLRRVQSPALAGGLSARVVAHSRTWTEDKVPRRDVINVCSSH